VKSPIFALNQTSFKPNEQRLKINKRYLQCPFLSGNNDRSPLLAELIIPTFEDTLFVTRQMRLEMPLFCFTALDFEYTN
jgi:hypothetical protein